MGAIFISYRREDAEGQAGRLFDDLVAQFGANSVFMDVAGLEVGRDFRRAIENQVASCGVLLALIGKDWLDAKNESGQRRLDDAMDFVRLETASALKRDIPVVPVLVRGATMPRIEDLPADLKELAYRNAVELTHARWDSDVQLLAKALTPYVQREPKTVEPSVPSPASTVGGTPTRSRWPIIAALVSLLLLGLLVGVVGYFWYLNSSREAARLAAEREAKNRATQTPTPTSAPTREVIRPISAPPNLLSPSDGTEFAHYPRRVTLAWEGVPSARGYKVEIQFESNGWHAFGQIKNTNTTTHSFDFIGAQPGRWRVWAVDAEGREGPKSEWWGFHFTQ